MRMRLGKKLIFVFAIYRSKLRWWWSQYFRQNIICSSQNHCTTCAALCHNSWHCHNSRMLQSVGRKKFYLIFRENEKISHHILESFFFVFLSSIDLYELITTKELRQLLRPMPTKYQNM